MRLTTRRARAWAIGIAVPIALLAGILLLLMYLGVFTRDLVGRQSNATALAIPPDSFGLSGEVVRFSSRDGIALEGWWLPGTPPGRAVVVLSHGGGSARSRMLERAAFLVHGSLDVLAIDLRAHGGSEGEYSSLGYMEALDVLGAVDYLQQRGESRPIVLMGSSLGSVASLNAAARYPDVAAVIAEGAYASYGDMLRRFCDLGLADPDTPFLERILLRFCKWPPAEMVWRVEYRLRTGVDLAPERADALEAVKRIQSPILFVTGEHDPFAPVEDARKMLEAAANRNSQMAVIEGAGHSAFRPETRDQYETAVWRFLDEVLGGSPDGETEGPDTTVEATAGLRPNVDA